MARARQLSSPHLSSTTSCSCSLVPIQTKRFQLLLLGFVSDFATKRSHCRYFSENHPAQCSTCPLFESELTIAVRPAILRFSIGQVTGSDSWPRRPQVQTSALICRFNLDVAE